MPLRSRPPHQFWTNRAAISTLELPDDQAQPVDLGLSFAQRAGQIADELLQCVRVGRQGIERDPHVYRLAAQARAYNLNARQAATINRRVCTGVRHSNSSNSIDICAVVSVTDAVPFGDGCVLGQVKAPWSRRLANRHVPCRRGTGS